VGLSHVLVQLGLRSESRPTRGAFESINCLLRGRLHVRLSMLRQFAFGIEFCTARLTFVLPSKEPQYSAGELQARGDIYQLTIDRSEGPREQRIVFPS
jgi:hypothetical protein